MTVLYCRPPYESYRRTSCPAIVALHYRAYSQRRSHTVQYYPVRTSFRDDLRIGRREYSDRGILLRIGIKIWIGYAHQRFRRHTGQLSARAHVRYSARTLQCTQHGPALYGLPHPVRRGDSSNDARRLRRALPHRRMLPLPFQPSHPSLLLRPGRRRPTSVLSRRLLPRRLRLYHRPGPRDGRAVVVFPWACGRRKDDRIC